LHCHAGRLGQRQNSCHHKPTCTYSYFVRHIAGSASVASETNSKPTSAKPTTVGQQELALPRSNTDPQPSDQQLLRLGPKHNWTKVQPVYPSTGSL
jgi:hypothetical protein